MRKKTSNQNTLVILLAFLIIMIIGLVIGIALVKIMRDGGLAGDDDAESDDYVDYVSEIDSIIRDTDERISKAESNEEKAALYLERGGRIQNIILGSDGGVEIEGVVSRSGIDAWEIICEDAYEAEKLKPSSNTALLVFDCESERGNQELADKYLEIATERAKTDGQGGG